MSGQWPVLPWCCPVGRSVVRISMEHAAVRSGFIVKVWVPNGKQTHCSHRVNGCPSVGYKEGGIAMGTLRLQIKSPCETEAKTPLWSSAPSCLCLTVGETIICLHCLDGETETKQEKWGGDTAWKEPT